MFQEHRELKNILENIPPIEETRVDVIGGAIGEAFELGQDHIPNSSLKTINFHYVRCNEKRYLQIK